jgi:ferredoxin
MAFIMVSLMVRQTAVETSLIMVSNMTVKTVAKTAQNTYLIMESEIPQLRVLETMEGTTPILELFATRQGLTCGWCGRYIRWSPLANSPVLCRVVADRKACWGCGVCRTACAPGALSLEPRAASADVATAW